MDMMGQEGDREHYIKVRQESRAIDLAKQNAKIANGIHLLEKHLAGELLKGKKPEDLKKSPFVSKTAFKAISQIMVIFLSELLSF